MTAAGLGYGFHSPILTPSCFALLLSSACFTPLPFEIVYIISNMFCPLFAWDRRIQPDSPITLNRVGWQRICSVKHGDGKFFLAYFIFHPKNIYIFLFIIQCLTLKNLPHAINLVKVM